MDILPSFFGSDYIFLIIGFIILIKGADVMVHGATNIARIFKISPLIVGLTIVAFGTSAPELFVNSFSAFKGQTDLAIGNVIGSNIANICLVLGVAAIVYPLQAKNSTVYKEVPFSLLAGYALLFLSFDTIFSGSTINIISRGDSLVLLLFFLIFFSYTFNLLGSSKEDTSSKNSEECSSGMIKSIIFVLLGLIGLALGAEFLVCSAKNIASSFGVSETLIGLTIVAFGTSLPELVTSIIAALKKQADIVIGNVVGSNIFNILLVLGVTGFIQNIELSGAVLIDMLVQLGATSLLIAFLFFFGKCGRLTRSEGIIFLSIYFLYIGYLII